MWTQPLPWRGNWSFAARREAARHVVKPRGRATVLHSRFAPLRARCRGAVFVDAAAGDRRLTSINALAAGRCLM